MRRHIARVAIVATLALGGCEHRDQPLDTQPCHGLVDVSDAGAFVQYSARKDRYWDVTMAMLQNRCSHTIDVVGVELGAAMGVAEEGATVAPRPDQVFAAAPVPPDVLPPLQPFAVAAGATVQVVGRFAVTGTETAQVPSATLTFRDGARSSTLTLTPKVSLCTCGPPG